AIDRGIALRQHERRPGARIFRRRHGRGDHYRALPHPMALRDRPQFELYIQGPGRRREASRPRARRALCPRGLSAQGRQPGAHHAQLIDAGTNAHLWADRFDGSLEDVFELQDRVAISVAGVIEPTLEAAEIRRSSERPTGDITAYDQYLRA